MAHENPERKPIERKGHRRHRRLLPGLARRPDCPADRQRRPHLVPADWLKSLGIPLLPDLITYVSGYVARHTARPNLPFDQR
jgi:hypothetical protein